MGQALIVRRSEAKPSRPSTSIVNLNNIPPIARVSGTTVKLGEARSHLCAVSTSTQMVFLCGKKLNGDASNKVDAIDSALTVRNPAPATTPRFNAGSTQVNGKTFIGGGENGQGPVASVETWTQTFTHQSYADLPMAVINPATTTFNNCAVFIGGENPNLGSSQHMTTYTYTGTQTAYMLDDQRSGAAAITFAGRLYLIGGSDVFGPTNEICVWNTDFTKLYSAFLSIPRNNPLVIATDEYLFVIGGTDRYGGVVDAIEVFNTDLMKEGVLSLPHPVKGICGFVKDGYVYLCGGEEGETTYSDIITITPNLEMKIFLGTSVPRAYAATANIDQYNLVGGGKNSNGVLNSIDVYKKFDSIVLPPSSKYKLGSAEEVEVNSALILDVSGNLTTKFEISEKNL